MKALPPTNKKLRPMIKFIKSRSNSKVKGKKVKVMLSYERSYHKEYTFKYESPSI
jgi:hypothetical protein